MKFLCAFLIVSLASSDGDYEHIVTQSYQQSEELSDIEDEQIDIQALVDLNIQFYEDMHSGVKFFEKFDEQVMNTLYNLTQEMQKLIDAHNYAKEVIDNYEDYLQQSENREFLKTKLLKSKEVDPLKQTRDRIKELLNFVNQSELSMEQKIDILNKVRLNLSLT